VRGARILVAEDNEESLELLREYLEALEYTVAAATDGNRALDMGGTGQFDLMILDVHMPLYDGTEVLRMLRVRHRLRPIKVIALTADVLPETRQELDRAGVNGFLAKPVNLDALRLEIERVLDQG
jgi:CheY-like chemotaxis protein